MEALRIIILGIIQGLTEFIPISSSAHLIVVRELLHWEDLGLSFDMAIHLGTLLALIIYMRRDWYEVLTRKRYLLFLVILATIPGAIFGLFLEGIAEAYFRSLPFIGIAMSIFGIVLFTVDRLSRHNRSLENMQVKDAIIIGLSQVLALIPGVSRSGATLTGAFLCNFRRSDSARFSFLLSVPIIGGAGLVSLLKIVREPSSLFSVSGLFLGIITSFIFGYIAVHFMLNYLRRHNTNIFVYYRLIMGLFLIIFSLIKG
ncbi:MAG: undecaprenyl-diphosphate phosphatase [bacterium]|nr:undecaprenyl-diphosphate phosphatase [bacterium]